QSSSESYGSTSIQTFCGSAHCETTTNSSLCCTQAEFTAFRAVPAISISNPQNKTATTQQTPSTLSHNQTLSACR
ncbi:hypothetical protein M9458_028594, partial [Cirrhinus mrigala]